MERRESPHTAVLIKRKSRMGNSNSGRKMGVKSNKKLWRRAKSTKNGRVGAEATAVGASNVADGFKTDDPAITREVSELRALFKCITKSTNELEFQDLCQIGTIKAQLSAGDLSMEVIESLWLEAVSKQLDDEKRSDVAVQAGGKKPGEVMWGINTCLSFEGFLQLLQIAEESAAAGPEVNAGLVHILEEEPVMENDEAAALQCEAQKIIYARRQLIKYLRASLIVDFNGDTEHHVSSSGNLKEQSDIERGNKLYAAVLREAVELNLEHRESKEELVRRGVIKSSAAAAQAKIGITQAQLAHHMKNSPSCDELIQQGVLINSTPNTCTLEKQLKKDIVKHHLEKRQSREELVASGVLKEGHPDASAVNRAFLSSKLSHDLNHRHSREELQNQGIMMNEDAVGDYIVQHHEAGSQIGKALSKRPDVSELKESGIYVTTVEDKGKKIRHEMAKDALRGKLDPDTRPTKDELKERGVISGSNHMEHLLAAHNLKHGLEHRENVEDLKAQGIYPVMSKEAHAVERDLVTRNLREKLENRESIDSLREVGIYQTPLEEKMMNLETRMTKDALTSSLKHRVDRSELETAGIYKASSPSSLAEGRATIAEQVARGLEHRLGREEAEARGLIPESADADVEKHEAMARRQAIMASAVAAQLEHRDSREALKNKGIIVDCTPQEAAVQRAFISHILAYGLAHRESVEDITNKGILLPMDADALHEAHRQARNTLEGALAARSSVETVVKEGYMETDELMELYSELCEGKEGGLKMEPLLSWQPVADMLSSGIIDHAAMEAAFREAASKEGNKEQLTFTQFLSFIELVDMKQEGFLLSLEDAESDDEDTKEHKLRLRAKRERIAKAEEVNLWSYSLTERLESFFKNRPDRSNPEVRRLSKDFHSAVALELEDRILADQLARSLRARASLTDLKARGIHDSSEVLQQSSGSVHAKELEFAFNRRLLGYRLARRCAREELQNKGVLHVESPKRERLHRDMARHAISRALDCHSPHHLQELMDRGIYFKTTPKGKKLEQKLHAASLARHLAKRPSAEDLELRGILTSGPPPVTGLQDESRKSISNALSRKDLQGSLSLGQTIQLTPHIPLSEAAAAVDAALSALSMKSHEEKDRLIETGILKDSTPQEAALETHLKSKAVEHGLQVRDSIEALQNKGIYVNTTVRARELEHQIIADMLNHKLRARNRPSIDDLKAQGIYLGVSAEQQNMSKCLALRNLRRRLEKRQTAEELMSRGVLHQERPVGDPHAAHERLLCSALLARGLSRHFNPEEIAQLKQKGIYQAAFPDAEHLKAQHNLVSSQLSRLMKRRSSESELQEEMPHLMEMNLLAIVFEDAAGGGAEPGTGWQCTASLESLRAAWSPIADFVADQEQEAYTYFDVCDHDGDGEINFSEFLRFVELCGINPEDHIGVDDDLLRSLFAKSSASGHSPGHIEQEKISSATAPPRLSMTEACNIKLVARWIQQAELDHPCIVNFWGHDDSVDCETFISFCRRCEAASAHAQISWSEAARACAVEEAKVSKETLKQKLINKLNQRSDYVKLKETHMIKDDISAASLHLECNLIAIHLKQKLLQRPAIECLKQRGILLPEGLCEEHAHAAKVVGQSSLFDKTMKHDDAAWQASQDEAESGARINVSVD